MATPKKTLPAKASSTAKNRAFGTYGKSKSGVARNQGTAMSTRNRTARRRNVGR